MCVTEQRNEKHFHPFGAKRSIKRRVRTQNNYREIPMTGRDVDSRASNLSANLHSSATLIEKSLRSDGDHRAIYQRL